MRGFGCCEIALVDHMEDLFVESTRELTGAGCRRSQSSATTSSASALSKAESSSPATPSPSDTPHSTNHDHRWASEATTRARVFAERESTFALT